MDFFGKYMKLQHFNFFNKKTATALLLTCFVFTTFVSPVSLAHAQEEPELPQDSGAAENTLFVRDPDAQALDTSGFTTEGTGEGISGQAATDLFSCMFGQSLAQVLAAALASILTDKIANMVSSILEVPVDSKTANNNARLVRAKETALVTIAGIPVIPSMDAMGYCIANTLIQYISEATLQWIKSGFKGKPIFVENPSAFFQTIADVEAGKVLSSIGNGFLCEPFQVDVQSNLDRKSVV